jgi:transcriptional regulator with XRE-family HTH domain
MSDLYLELKSRIPLVAARTYIGTDRLQELQDAKGLSNERLARLVPVSEKTWRRWKEAGEIPTYALPALAPILGLEIRGAAPERVEVSAIEPEQQQLVDVLRAVQTMQAEVESLRNEFQQVIAALPRAAQAAGS